MFVSERSDNLLYPKLMMSASKLSATNISWGKHCLVGRQLRGTHLLVSTLDREGEERAEGKGGSHRPRSSVS